VAAEQGLGWEEGSLMAAYTDNRAAAHDLALEANPIAAIIRDDLTLPFAGTATDLLSSLNSVAGEKTRGRRNWPKAAKSVSNILPRMSANLAAIGINVEFGRDANKTRRRTISIKRIELTGDHNLQ
jgi:hypothetical protein